MQRDREVLDLFGQRQEARIDGVAHAAQGFVEFGSRDELFVGALGRKYFFHQRNNGENGDGGNKPVFELADLEGGELH